MKREIPSWNLVDRSSLNDMSESCSMLAWNERTLLDYHIDVKLLEKYGNSSEKKKSEIRLNEARVQKSNCSTLKSTLDDDDDDGRIVKSIESGEK